MKARLQALAARVNARALRERVLLLGTAIVLIGVVADVVFLAPLRDALDQTASQRDEVAASLGESRDQLATLRDRLDEDPNTEIRQRIEDLERRLRGIDSRLSTRRERLIGASDMVAVLRGLIERDKGVELVTIESEPSQVVEEFAVGDSEKSDAVPARVYRHGVHVVLEGRFGDAVGYLRAVEDLRWRFFWDQLDIEVIDYPTTRIRVRVHTLSLDEDWIGV